MKFNTIIAVLAITLACVATGCRYNKAAKGGAGADGGLNTNPTGLESDIEDTAQGGSLDDLMQNKKFDEDENYVRCDDISLAPIYFGLDSYAITEGEISKVDAVVRHLTDNADRVVIVEGHCDDRGSNEYNMSLGEKRALSVYNVLVENEINASRIQTRSWGEERPAVEGRNNAAWDKNRRAEFLIFKAK